VRLPGEVTLTEALGSELVAHVEVPARPAITEATREVAADVDEVAIDRLRGDSAVLVGRFSARSDVKAGQSVEVAVDNRALHLFDPQTAQAISQGGE
jgi:multiple sugar transport system ATP-binding protein